MKRNLKNSMQITSLCALFIAAGPVGCTLFQKQQVTTDANGTATTNTVVNVQAIAPLVKTAAKEGTRLPLIEHPEWRDSYVQAVNQLKVIEASPTIDFSLVTKIVQQLPLQQLKSPEAQIAIEGGTLILNTVDAYLASQGKGLSLEQVNDVKAVVTALRQGVEEGLASLP